MQASSCFSKATARSSFFDVPVLSNALPIAGKSKRKQPRRRGRSRRGDQARQEREEARQQKEEERRREKAEKEVRHLSRHRLMQKNRFAKGDEARSTSMLTIRTFHMKQCCLCRQRSRASGLESHKQRQQPSCR